VGKQIVPSTGSDKTSLLVSTQNVAGGLHRLLTPLAQHGISMTRIESRPSRRGIWEYVFFLDIEGHEQDPTVARALADLQRAAGMYKVLGSYPRAVL
jgi:chorismate mutase/prephenate dehydratase